MLFCSAPLFCATAATSAAFNSDHFGKALQPLLDELFTPWAITDATGAVKDAMMREKTNVPFFMQTSSARK